MKTTRPTTSIPAMLSEVLTSGLDSYLVAARKSDQPLAWAIAAGMTFDGFDPAVVAELAPRLYDAETERNR